MNTKAKGSRNERKTIRILESQGYNCCKSGASLGVWDIIAIRRDGIKLVQVKSNGWCGSVEMEAMQLFGCPACCSKELWRWDDHARQPRVKLI